MSWLRVVGARQNNLKNITVEIPLGRFVAVTGVSGSGKSSLVNDIVREALARDLNGAASTQPGAHDRIEGIEHLDKVIDIDQSPIGRTPRSNPATYIKVFDEIRALFTRLPDAKVRGYKPGRFSFNVPSGKEGGGRCEACEGNGSHRIEMDFLADIWVTCPVCGGHRFSRETLQVLYKGRSIAQVLEMDVQQGLEHFGAVPKIARMLQTLHDVGLDYLKLGQSSTTLSGGEAQRIKLARELVKRSTGRTLYILDEPTTGLHFADIKRLLAVLHGFVDAGNTVLVIEHNLDVVKTADWVIDLGPEGGAQGGAIVAIGTPEELAACDASHTGMALRDVLSASTTRAAPSRARLRDELPRRGNGSSANGRERAKSADGGELAHPWADRVEKSIVVVGARQHNLKNATVEIPRGAMTICSGPSGSGKSSFAIDTVYAEGQRRYVESLSSYARQFLGRLQPPKVDHVYGLSPAISIEQRNTSRSPRSTVGTVTEIYDYMRVLWARVGEPYCPDCNVPVGTQTRDAIVDRLMRGNEGARVMILSPVEPGPSESFNDLLRRERANGFSRVRVEGELRTLDDSFALDPLRKHQVDIVVDRVVIRASQRARIADSVEQALTLGRGVMVALWINDGEADAEGADAPRGGESPAGQRTREQRLSQHRSCETCGRGFDEMTPHHFSFNSRIGWCETCEGIGTQLGAGPAAVVRDPRRSILDGALMGWSRIQDRSLLADIVMALARLLGFDPKTPWSELDAGIRSRILQGCGADWIPWTPPIGPTEMQSDSHVAPGTRFRWRGFFPAIARAMRMNRELREQLGDMLAEVPCDACAGSRLRSESAAVRVGGATLNDVCSMPLARSLGWFESLRLDERREKIAGELLREVRSRLRFLVDVGLDYMTLDRTSATLSGGEAQRIQLASQIGTGLTGVLYVLDEPTIGLHPRDNARLIGALQRLRDLGNTLVVVEHDREVIAAADHLLDFGPGAGVHGGQVTAKGAPEAIARNSSSPTGKYLSGAEFIPVPTSRRTGQRPSANSIPSMRRIKRRPARSRFAGNEGSSRRTKQGALAEADPNDPTIVVHGAFANNLKHVTARFPLGRFICVTGVSGSGKSSLVSDVLHQTLTERLHGAQRVQARHEGVSGLEFIDKVINVDQSPIGLTPTSNPATYTGVFDPIRALFASLPVSKMRGYSANRFSFNRPGGRCEACEGMGQRRVEMHFLPDVWVVCEACGGKRFTAHTQDVKYHGKSIADVLEMPVSEALRLFASVPRVVRLLRTLEDVGLGYIQLGQSAATLSGGEAQRVKLATELGKTSTGRTLYLLDEPTTGLHFDDLKKLLAVLHRLVDLGNTVICVEHNLDVIKTADWVIDMGPEAGDAGGTIVVEGPPELVASTSGSHTGAALKPVLDAGPREDRVVFDAKWARKNLGDRAESWRAAISEARHAPTAGDGEPPLFADTHARDQGEATEPDIEPWRTNGKDWHLSQRCLNVGQVAKWSPVTLLSLIGKFCSWDPTLRVEWNEQTSVKLVGTSKAHYAAKIVTNMGSDLRVEACLPSGLVRREEVYGLGREPWLRPEGVKDRLIFRVITMDDCDLKGLENLWRRRAAMTSKTGRGIRE